MAAASPLGGGVRLLALLLFASILAPAATDDGPHSWFVVIAGLGGMQPYDTQFREQADEFARIAVETSGDQKFVRNLVGVAATRDSIRATLREVTGQVREQDSFTLVLIGHGSFDDRVYKFNVPGPDITDRELLESLNLIPAKRQLVVSATSASGAIHDALASETRIVISATKSGRERNATVFAQFWNEALESEEADLDKNSVLTAKEAFQYAERKVKEHFETDKKLATEHPRMEGGAAASFTLARLGSVQQAAEDPALRPILAKREAVEQRIEALKLRKAEMTEDEYFSELQKLLLELAKLEQTLPQ